MKKKFCVDCNNEKEIEEFPFKNKEFGLRRNQCRLCYNAYFRKYFKNKDNLKLQSQRVKNRKSRLIWDINSYKLSIGCQICGYKRCPAALQFHHKDPSNLQSILQIMVHLYYLIVMELLNICLIM